MISVSLKASIHLMLQKGRNQSVLHEICSELHSEVCLSLKIPSTLAKHTGSGHCFFLFFLSFFYHHNPP